MQYATLFPSRWDTLCGMNRTSFTRIGTFFTSDDRMRAIGFRSACKGNLRILPLQAFATAHKVFTFDNRREGFSYKNWNLRILSI